ncbi:MAG TPA: YceI family protein [Pyrinomonadaceae bacterium]
MFRKCLVVVAMLSLLFIAPAGNATSYNVDTNHSTIGFNVSILGGLSKVSGKFTSFAVVIDYDEADVTKSSVTANIKADSINTGIEKRDAHLKTADFFDVAKYPEITFQSKRVEKKGNQLVATGTFTMHGVSKEISIPFTVTGKVTNPTTKIITYGFSARLVLNRRDYGINWQHNTVPNWVGDEVEIELDLITSRPVENKTSQ